MENLREQRPREENATLVERKEDNIKMDFWPGMVAHACNPSTWEA